jgi:hypothetical protein
MKTTTPLMLKKPNQRKQAPRERETDPRRRPINLGKYRATNLQEKLFGFTEWIFDASLVGS